ncbi:glycosyltransferase family 2 protein [bacterium]|nr:glycosyltransferase family 2 protein [bacterium]
MPNPKISCYCPTYGRTSALEEAIYSFLKQDYDGEKELVILNDLEDQTLFFDHPEIKIINSKQRIMPLGKKLNECISHCSGEYIFVWDDDDIFFPWKISFTIKNLNNDGIFHTNQGFYEEEIKKLSLSSNLFHSNLCMHKNCWEKTQYYVEIDTSELDLYLFQKIKNIYNYNSKKINDEDIFYVYRWKTIQSYHCSFYKNNTSLETQKIVKQKILNKLEPVGNIILKPHWKYDYLEARNICLKNKK